MQRTGRVVRVAALVVIALAAALVAGAAAVELTDIQATQKETCLSNLKQIALACLMYAQDYDEVLPSCAPSDAEGTAHAIAKPYRNLPRRDFEQRIEQTYGKQYVDGRWSWQLADAVMPYVRSIELFDCPTLTEVAPRLKLATYVVGRDKETRERDPSDPIARHLGPGDIKVTQSGSYVYMCAHFPFGVGKRAALYGRSYADAPGIPLFALWDAANLLGVIGRAGYLDPANPEDRMICGVPLKWISDPAQEPMVMCNSLGVHEGYAAGDVKAQVLTREATRLLGYAAAEPTVPAATVVGYVDGHVKYTRAGFDDFMRMLYSANPAR